MGLDAATLRRALGDLFKFDPKDFFVQAAGTGFLVRSARPNTPPPFCDFKLSNASDGETLKIRLGWGRVNGGQPIEFDGVLYIDQTIEENTYIFVYATYDQVTAQWSDRHILFSDTAEVENTSTEAYSQIGAAVIDEDTGALSITGTCGEIFLDPCTLLIEEEE